MKQLIITFKLLCLTVTFSFAQVMYNTYPANWWIGMKYNKIQLMIRADGVGNHTGFTTRYAGVTITKVNRFANKNYVILDMTIAPTAKPGTIGITTKKGTETVNFEFNIANRRPGRGTEFAQGVTSSDLMYLIMPDRFSNGDKMNDKVPGMRDQTLRRDTVFNRHGGDLKGIENHLDYLKDLGVTSIWLNPVWENDRTERTEHGYAFTDHYKIDPRLGGYMAMRNLVNAMHKKGIKYVSDAVYNHIDIDHFLYRDMPDSTWFHRWPSYTQTNYKDQTLFDPYAAIADKKIMSDGWFTNQMPDWDQSNLFVQNFLIQHAIWSVEEFGIDGFRIDTYAYNDLDFMNRCNKALYDDYPKITIFGETWVHGVINQAYYCENVFNIKYKSNMHATTDFQTLFYGITPACNDNFGWTDGVNRLYTTLAQDIVYKDPMRQVVFLDNHDIPRFYSVVGEDTSKYKMAYAWMLTTRGIPQMYYGNEILMAGTTSPNDGYVRLDFPGGWEGDAVNKFTAAGRTEKENSIFNYIRRLANFRLKSSAIKTGKMMQFLPVDGVYVYFRYDNNQTVMCIMNTNKEPKTIDLARFKERMKDYTAALDVAAGQVFQLEKTITLMPVSNLVLELKQGKY
jgi:neopullulanase